MHEINVMVKRKSFKSLRFYNLTFFYTNKEIKYSSSMIFDRGIGFVSISLYIVSFLAISEFWKFHFLHIINPLINTLSNIHPLQSQKGRLNAFFFRKPPINKRFQNEARQFCIVNESLLP